MIFIDAIIKYILSLDVSTITTYMNYSFVALAVVFFIGFLFGLFKGIYRASSSFIASCIVLIVIVFTNKAISNFLYNMNIEGLTQVINYELPEGITTLGQMVEKFVCDQLKEMGYSVDYSQISDSIQAIAKSLINIVTLIVMAIIGLLDIIVLDILLYNTLFRFGVSKEKRKKNKKRILASFVSAVNATVVFALLMSPFTALLNSITAQLRDENGEVQREPSDNDYYNAVMNIVQGYNDSSLAKLFFSFTTKEGKTYDVALLDQITSSSLDNGKKINSYTEIGNLVSLGMTALGSGAIKSTGEIDLALLLSSSLITEMLDMVKDSVLLQTLLSLGATIAINNDSLKENVDLTSIDFYDVDWSTNATAIKGVYEELQSVGLITDVVVNTDTFLSNFQLDDPTYAPKIKNALRKLDDSTVLKSVVPLVVTSYMKKLSTGEIKANKEKKSRLYDEVEAKEETSIIGNISIPETLLNASSYEDFNWGSELASIYEFGEDLSRQYRGYYGKGITYGELNTINTSTFLDILFGQGIDFTSELDASYADQFLNNKFVNGGTYNGLDLKGAYSIFGINDDEGLLNIQLADLLFDSGFVNNLVDAVDFDKLVNNTSTTYSLSGQIQNLIKDFDKADWKEEFGSIIKVGTPLVNIVSQFNVKENATPSNKKLQNSEQEQAITISLNDLLSDKTLDSMKYLTDVLNESELFENVLPEFLDNYFEQNDQELLPGLSLSSLNFTSFVNSDESLTTELRKVVDILSDNNEDLITLISDIASNPDDALEVIIDDCAKGEDSILSILLNTINDSQIFNDQTVTGDKTFTKLMINLLGKTSDESLQYNIYNMTNHLIGLEEETIRNIDTDPNLSWSKEILGLTKFISSLKAGDGENGILMNYLLGKQPADFQIEKEIYKCGDEIERLLSTVDDSSLLSGAITDLISSVMGDELEKNLGVKPNFNNVASWKDEGVYLNNFLSTINDILDGNDISTLDIASLNSEKVENLLNAIYDTQCIGGKYVDNQRVDGVFDELVEKVVLDALESALNIDFDVRREKSMIDQDFSISSISVKYDDSHNVSWKGNDTYNGEIRNIALLINEVKDLDENTKLEDMGDILTKVNESYVLRTVLSIILEEKTSSLDDELTKDFISRSNLQIFNTSKYSLTPYHIVDDEIVNDPIILNNRKDEITNRQEELDYIIDVLSNINEVVDALDSADIYTSIQNVLINSTVLSSSTRNTSILEDTLNAMYASKVFNDQNSSLTRELTAFEYVFSYINNDTELKEILKPISDSEIIEMSNDNVWTSEIKNFSDTLYELVNNELVKSINDGDTSISSINNKLQGKHLIKDLFTSMNKSKMFDRSLTYVLDTKFLTEVISSIGYEVNDEVLLDSSYSDVFNYYLNNKDLILTNLNNYNADPSVLASFDSSNPIKYLIENEALALENLIKSCCALLDGNSDLSSIDIKSTTSLDTKLSDIFDSISSSLVLNYLDEDYGINYISSNKEISLYQALIHKVINLTNESLDSMNLDLSLTSTKYILSYKNEQSIILDMVSSYQDMDLDDIDNIELTDANVNKIINLLKDLYSSNVYNYTKVFARPNETEDYSYSHYLSVFEQIIYSMSTQSSMIDMVYSVNNINQTSYSSSEQVLFEKIKEITESDKNNNEIVWFNDSDTSEISKLKKIIVRNVDFTINDEIINNSTYFKYDCDTDSYSGLLVDINESYLLHDIISNYVDQINNNGFSYTQGGVEKVYVINDVLCVPSTIDNYYQVAQPFTIDGNYYNGDISFATCNSKWNNDIYYLIESMKQLRSLLENPSFNSAYSDGSTKVFETLLSNLSNTTVYHQIVDQLLMSIFADLATMTYMSVTLRLIDLVSNPDVTTSEYQDYAMKLMEAYPDELTAKEEKFRKFITLHNIYDVVYPQYEYDWQKEGKGIDELLKSIIFHSSYDSTANYLLANDMASNLVIVTP